MAATKKSATLKPRTTNTAATLKKCGSPVALKPHPLLALIPSMTPAEVQTRRQRVSAYGQREPIEVLDGRIVAGFDEYTACLALGRAPKLTEVKAPTNLTDYVLRRNIPRELSGIVRGCIGVVAYEQMAKTAGVQRKAEGGRLKGKISEKEDPDPWIGKRWFEHVAPIVGVKPGCVRRLASIRREDPAVFQAIYDGRIQTLTDASALITLKWAHADDVLNPRKNETAEADRGEVLQRYEASKKKIPIAALVYEVRREKRIKELPPPIAKGTDYVVYAGPMAEHAAKIQSGSIDAVVADILYGDKQAPPMAHEVAALSKRVLVNGGVLALMAGHIAIPKVIEAVQAAGMHFLTVGFIDYAGGSGEGLRGKVCDRVDCDPILFFSSTVMPARRLTHLKFKSGQLDKRFFAWQKSTDAMTGLVLAVAGMGRVVLDPCCGSGSTGEACLRTGNRFVGIEMDIPRAKIAQARLSEVEKSLATAEVAKIIESTNRDSVTVRKQKGQ